MPVIASPHNPPEHRHSVLDGARRLALSVGALTHPGFGTGDITARPPPQIGAWTGKLRSIPEAGP